MAGTQRLLASAMAFFLANFSGSSRPEVLGIVLQADHASLDERATSAGTTIYDGDRLATDAEGYLRLVAGEAMLSLEAQSSVVVRRDAGTPAGGLEVQLLSGTAVISATAGSSAAIVVSSTPIRPLAATRGVAQVRFVGANELLACAQRGPAEVTYCGESATIEEGKCDRVLLNAADDNASGTQAPRKPGKRAPALLLIAIGAATAAGIALAWRGGQRGLESPDRPYTGDRVSKGGKGGKETKGRKRVKPLGR